MLPMLVLDPNDPLLVVTFPGCPQQLTVVIRVIGQNDQVVPSIDPKVKWCTPLPMK